MKQKSLTNLFYEEEDVEAGGKVGSILLPPSSLWEISIISIITSYVNCAFGTRFVVVVCNEWNCFRFHYATQLFLLWHMEPFQGYIFIYALVFEVLWLSFLWEKFLNCDADFSLFIVC